MDKMRPFGGDLLIFLWQICVLHKRAIHFLCSTTSRILTPPLVPTGKRILLPHFEKKLIPSHLYLMGEVIFEVRLQIFVALHKSYNLFLYSIKLKKVLHLYCEKSSNN